MKTETYAVKKSYVYMKYAYFRLQENVDLLFFLSCYKQS